MYIYFRRAYVLLLMRIWRIIFQNVTEVCFFGLTILFTTRTWFKSTVLHSLYSILIFVWLAFRLKPWFNFDWARHKVSEILYIYIYVLLYLPFITCKAYIQNTNVYISKCYLWKSICSYWRFYQYPPQEIGL